MGNGSHKHPEPAREGSIATGQTVVTDDDLLTDPRMQMEDPLQEPEDPTVPGGLRLDARVPVVSVPETEAARLAREGLVAVDPAAYPGRRATFDPAEEATAALNLPPESIAIPPRPVEPPTRPHIPPSGPAIPPRPVEPPTMPHHPPSARAPEPPTYPHAHPRGFDSHVGTRSDRAPSPIGPGEASQPTGRMSSEALPGFVEPSLVMPAQPMGGTGPTAGRSPFEEPSSLPGGLAHEAPPFVVDEDTFGPNAPLEPGGVVAFGLYRVERLLGEGPTTRVYLATDLRDGTQVALKEFLEPGQALRAPSVRNLLERFRQDEPAPAVLQHEHCIRLLDFFDDTTRGPMIVMEYIPAGDLEAFLTHRGRPLSPREAASLFSRVCEALGHALDHGVVHGNLQPRNILLTPDAQPKVDLVMPVLLGQPVVRPEEGFAAPEVQAGGPASPASDVYGVGASLYQAVTDPRVAAEGGAAPGEIEPIIARCVEDQPQHRYATVRELGADLRRVLDPSPARVLRQTPPRRLAQLGLALFAVAGGLAGGVWVATRGPSSAEVAATPAASEGSAPVSDVLMQDARRLEADGQLLAAAAAYQRLLDADPGLSAPRAARQRLDDDPDYKKALRDLRRRLRKADPDDAAQLRADLELLGILEPRDALIDHWRSRLNQSNDKGATGGPAP
jgi:serine/threonine protein kinase